MQILNSLIPIFAVIGLGMLLRKRNFLTADSTRAFNQFAYFFALPLFLFYKLASAATPDSQTNAMLITLLTATVLTAILGWAVAILLKVPFRSRGAMIQASFRGNLAFVGLPVALFAIGDISDVERSALEAAILLVMTPVVLFNNVGSVIALAAFNEKTERRFSFSMMFLSLVRNPIIWGALAGAIFQFYKWHVPTPVLHVCEIIGASAFALALIGIGSQLVSIPFNNAWTKAIVPTLIKCVLTPIICYVLGRMMGLTGIEFQAVVILSAAPTAVSSFVLSDQMDGDSDLAATAVVLCTAFSFITLSLALLAT